MTVDQELRDAAIELVENPSVETCHETGALCEAYRLDRALVASVCVTRSNHNG